MRSQEETSSIEDSEDDYSEISKENLNKNYLLDHNLKLSSSEMIYLKEIIDDKINQNISEKKETDELKISIQALEKLDQVTRSILDKKLTKLIPVEIESINEKIILVKIGPCDLSGVGGHVVREALIKDLVNQALRKKGFDGYDFKNVSVSACVGVRGRAQMVTGRFFENRGCDGAHMNAYIKTKNEDHLTHWEPRKGPQRFFNDTICGIVVSTITSLFEKEIRNETITSADEATKKILKNLSLVEVFDNILKATENRMQVLIDGIQKIKFSAKSLLSTDQLSRVCSPSNR